VKRAGIWLTSYSYVQNPEPYILSPEVQLLKSQPLTLIPKPFIPNS